MHPANSARRVLSVLGACLAVALAGASLAGQASTQAAPTATDPALRVKWFKQHEAMKQASPFKHLACSSWARPTSAADDGRRRRHAAREVVHDLRCDGDGRRLEDRQRRCHVGAVFDQDMTTSIGDVTLAPSNPDIVWLGTGEANIFRSSNAGAGVYKSADGGRTWQHMGLAATHTFPASSFIQPTRTRCGWRRRATSGPTTRSAGCSRRPTAASRGGRRST